MSSSYSELDLLYQVCQALHTRPRQWETLEKLSKEFQRHPWFSICRGLKGLASKFPRNLIYLSASRVIKLLALPTKPKPPNPAPAPPTFAIEESIKGVKNTDFLAEARGATLPTLKPFALHHRCDIFMVRSGSQAWQVLTFVQQNSITQVAIDIEGNLTREKGGVDVVQIGHPAIDGGKTSVYLWDYARAAESEHAGMTEVLRTILVGNPARKIMIHDGRADANALMYQLDIFLGDPVLDTQTMFSNWIRTTQMANARLAELKARCPSQFEGGMQSNPLVMAVTAPKPTTAELVYFAPTWANANRRAGLNEVLRTCHCQVNGHKDEMAKRFDESEENPSHTFWDLPASETTLVEYAAFDVDQLPAAVRFMQDALSWLHDWILRADSFLNLDSFRSSSWCPSELPKSVPVVAKFSDDCRLVWKFPDRDELECASDRPPSAVPIDVLGVDPAEYESFMAATAEEVEMLMAQLPVRISDEIRKIPGALETVNEIVMDLGYPVQLITFGARSVITMDYVGSVNQGDLDSLCAGLSFSTDNRAGMEGCLHRISRIFNRAKEVIGATVRIGRACAPGQGLAQLVQDLIASGNTSILIAGKPGTGKTHTLRDLCTRMVARRHRVVIVDTSNEVCGDGNMMHGTLKGCRRLQVADRDEQHEVLIEAVQNHTPDILVIDEIGNKAEVAAAQSVATRVGAIVASVHGSLASVLGNPVLRDLVGGLTTVTVGDSEMRAAGSKKKTRTERKGPPTFSAVIELISRYEVRVYRNIGGVIDKLLAPQQTAWRERRWLSPAAYSSAAAAAADPDPEYEQSGENGAVDSGHASSCDSVSTDSSMSSNSLQFFVQLEAVERDIIQEIGA